MDPQTHRPAVYRNVMKHPLTGKNIVLGVCGGIAAYKSAELLRLMVKNGASVRVMMTKHAHEFVGRVTFEALSGTPVCADLFETGGESAMKHIHWAETADAVVIAPATANMIGKLANGIADDAVSTFVMAVTAPVIICPSMNVNMYQSAAVQKNLRILKDGGFQVVSPDSGDLACGVSGPGRLPDPAYILDRLAAGLTKKDLDGRPVLITAGPTQEPLDPVRFISNPASGKMGFALARAAEHRGARVLLITGPSPLVDPPGVQTLRVETAEAMTRAVLDAVKDYAIVIKTAAVSDYRPVQAAATKIKKKNDRWVLELEQTTDILKEIGKTKQAGQILAGFAAETDDLEANAVKKLNEKNLDLIAANRIGETGSGFASDTNRVTLFYKNGHREVLPVMEKDAVAHLLLDRLLTLAAQ
jgi:phosphopantothenoylcysteine decarboxylase/phosphopantothenate--cysteine ligase